MADVKLVLKLEKLYANDCTLAEVLSYFLEKII